MAGAATGVTAAVGIAGVMAFMPFGVSFETLVLGGGCFFAGSCARTGLSLYKQLDGDGTVSYGREIAKLLCTTPVAAVASSLVFMAAHIAGINADTACGGVLLVSGVRGPDGFTWLMGIFADIFTKAMPGAKTSGDGGK